MFKLNGRLGRLLLNPSPSLLLMIQSFVQHMPKKMTYLPWRDGVDSEALPRSKRSLQEQLSKVRSGKSGDPKLTCLDTSLTEFRQPLQVQSHLEMPGILVQLGHTQRT